VESARRKRYNPPAPPARSMAPQRPRLATALVLLTLLGFAHPAAAMPDSATGAEMELAPGPPLTGPLLVGPPPEPPVRSEVPLGSEDPERPERPERPAEIPRQVAVGDLALREPGAAEAGPLEGGNLGTLHYPLAAAATEMDPWGWRYSEARGAWRMHTGLDLIVPEGTEVRAVQAGRVLRVDEIQGYGLTVLLDHGGGWSSLYAHLLRATVEPGEQLAAGQPLGLVGQSGNASTAHLHLELRQRQGQGLVAVDPTPWLAEARDSERRNRAASQPVSTTAAMP
jgi:murein DD-endopeptidase MepM/ murein hydrolase activator NlpD